MYTIAYVHVVWVAVSLAGEDTYGSMGVSRRSVHAEHLLHHRNIATRLVDIQKVRLVSILFTMVQVSFCLGDLGLWNLIGDAPSDIVLVCGVLLEVESAVHSIFIRS